MKKIITLILLLAQAIIPCAAVSDTATATQDVIIELVPKSGENVYAYAKNCADIISAKLPDFKYDYIYDTLLCGFSAEFPENALWRIESFDFVKKVYRSVEYEALDAKITESDMSAAAMAGYSAAEAAGIDGDGVKVAVLDSGFDVSHSAFSVDVTDTLDLSAFATVIGPSRLNALQNSTSITPLYYNSKIPFMYDYAYKDTDVFTSTSNHGTHVAGIIGAGKTNISAMHGIAPGCQLLLMKIFNDEGTAASDKALIAALEDALKLGADVINLSIGHYSGSASPSEIVGLPALLEEAEKKGCIIVAAVGNDSTTADRSTIYENDGIRLPLASYTDYGTLSSPASASSVMSTASVDNSVYYSMHFKHGQNRGLFIEYTDTNIVGGVLDTPFGKYFGGKTVEYAVIPGIGEASDYEGIDVAGKMVLVSRGTIPFTKKASVAASLGAIGLIVYNNTDEDYINMELTGAPIPAIAIRKADGQTLIDEAVHTVTFPTNYTTREIGDAAGRISTYSSYGTTPSLTLKPDISAVGGGVLSTIVGGGYGASSGTSMAAPQLSAACALLIERERELGASDNAAVALKVKNALMNTAVPVLQKNGTEYSPRAQGAGLINIDAALSQKVSLTFTDKGVAKAELYDKLSDSINFNVTVKNLTDAPLDVNLAVSLTNDGFTRLSYNGKSEYYSTLTAEADSVSHITSDMGGNLNKYTKDYAPLCLSLEAGAEQVVDIRITFDKAYRDRLAGVFTNGYFAEGFVFCQADGTAVSMPYMGYVGDWASAPILDGDSYAGETEMFDGSKFYVKVNGKYIPAGADIFSDTVSYDRTTIAFSPNGDENADDISFGASALRNAKSSKMTVTDEKGNSVFSSSFPYFSKIKSADEVTVFRFTWDGSDGMYNRYKLPDGAYRVELEYVLDYNGEPKQSYTYDVRIDTKAPTLTSASLSGDKLSISAYDEVGVRIINIYENDSDGTFSALAHGESAEFDIGAHSGDTLYYEIIDFAYNITVGKLNLSELSA